MHEISIQPALLNRLAQQRGGRRHMFDPLNPARTAHLVIDMQEGFLAPGAPVEVPHARAIIPNVNAISRAVRAAGGVNIFLRFTTLPEARDPWPAFYGRFTAAAAQAYRATFAPGAPQWRLWPGLDVAPGEACIDKTRFSAFVPGTCDLDEHLRAAGIDTLIISGTMTNCCCESTARDAMQRDYNVLFTTDATATLSDAEQNATLHSMGGIFADLLSAGELLTALA